LVLGCLVSCSDDNGEDSLTVILRVLLLSDFIELEEERFERLEKRLDYRPIFRVFKLKFRFIPLSVFHHTIRVGFL
jgi:hypothetical protein